MDTDLVVRAQRGDKEAYAIVDGMLTVIDWAYYEGTPRTVVDEARAIVESATFGE